MSDSKWFKCSCEEAPTSIIDDILVEDERASVVIVGGGPHALAALAALHDGGSSKALQKYGTGACSLHARYIIALHKEKVDPLHANAQFV